ncbi:unnamed protein product [Leptidea sinapis]|uniref:Major facilitator superfamily (MFS) profile domain-containing protein n=1 Tax=Leptidea sinapis TaxID=189913 RepID=A0A5E4QNN8_9NEOP|nr:unnamed protein product [Leptidea sinapis]
MNCEKQPLLNGELKSMKKLVLFSCVGGNCGKLNQFLCSLLICIPTFSYGNSIGWMSPMTLLLQSQESPRETPLTDLEISWMASLPYIACVPGTYLMAFIGDKFGRKNACLFMSAVGTIIWILKLCSLNFWVFVVARTLVGITMAGSCVTCPTYIREISEDSIRGALGCWPSLFTAIGSLFAYIIGDLLSYNANLWIFTCIPALHFVVFLMMPESPSYLVRNGEMEKATNNLSWLRRHKTTDATIKQELDVIMKEQKKDEENKQLMLKNIVSDKILFKAFQISLMAALSRELCGAVPVLNFAGDIFNLASKEGTGLVISPNQQAMMLGVVQLCGTMLASSVVEKSGRKNLLLVTTLISGVSMCLIASWFLIRDYNIHSSAWVPVITLCLCIFCDAAGLMPLSVVITGEIFSYKYRGSVLATTMAIASVADFFQLLFFKPLANSVGVYAAFYFFGLMCLLTSLYVIVVVPETKNRPLEDIYDDLRPAKGRVNIEQRHVI